MSNNKDGCQCKHCVGACNSQPGWFAPGEAEKAAAHLGLTFDSFKKAFLAIDHCDNHDADNAPFVYAPKKRNVDKRFDLLIRGRYEQYTEGPCIFLKHNRCGIHEVKPFECKKVYVCKGQTGFRNEIEELWIEAGAPLGMRP